MTLTVVSVAFPFARVTDDPAGGSEQVLAALDRTLVADGHRSIVIAPEGSTVAGALRPVPVAADPSELGERARIHTAVRAALADAIAREGPDLVHLHGLDFADYLPAPGPPALATLHLPLDWYPAHALRPDRPDTWLQPVSADQAARASAGVRLTEPVPNGVDLDRYRPDPSRIRGSAPALVLGRVAPEKGFHDAIDAAREARVPLIAAGECFPYPAHQAYLTDQVLPRLDAERRYVGPVAGAAKRALLSDARCLLVPSTAPETSSLVAMEALASGTPVIAYRSGALPSIVEHGRTGFIVDDVAGMAAAIGRLYEIDPIACRASAEARFPLTRMTGAYFDLYRRLALPVPA